MTTPFLATTPRARVFTLFFIISDSDDEITTLPVRPAPPSPDHTLDLYGYTLDSGDDSSNKYLSETADQPRKEILMPLGYRAVMNRWRAAPSFTWDKDLFKSKDPHVVSEPELRKKFEKAKKERDDLKLTLEKFQTSSKNLSKLLKSQVSDKTCLGYDSQVFNRQVFDCEELHNHESDNRVPKILENDRYKTGEGYHVGPPPYTGTFMPPKLDLVFNDAPNASKTVVHVFNVESKIAPDSPLMTTTIEDALQQLPSLHRHKHLLQTLVLTDLRIPLLHLAGNRSKISDEFPYSKPFKLMNFFLHGFTLIVPEDDASESNSLVTKFSNDSLPDVVVVFSDPSTLVSGGDVCDGEVMVVAEGHLLWSLSSKVSQVQSLVHEEQQH
nr:hypothetical protein [Tanacetum cinerariifolium]